MVRVLPSPARTAPEQVGQPGRSGQPATFAFVCDPFTTGLRAAGDARSVTAVASGQDAYDLVAIFAVANEVVSENGANAGL